MWLCWTHSLCPLGKFPALLVDELLCVKVHITSLASDADKNDVREYFKNICEALCEEDIKISSALLLGGGKAKLTLKGILTSGKQHFYGFSKQA